MPKHDTINCNTKCPPQVNNSLYTSSADFPPNCFLGYAFIYFSIFLIYALLHFPISVPFLIKRRMNLLLFSLLPPPSHKNNNYVHRNRLFPFPLCFFLRSSLCVSPTFHVFHIFYYEEDVSFLALGRFFYKYNCTGFSIQKVFNISFSRLQVLQMENIFL